MKSNFEMVISQGKIADDSLVKHTDLPLFWKVKDFLEKHKLDFRVVGSVVTNALYDRPRQYGSICLFVPNQIQKTGNAVYSLLEGYQVGENREPLRDNLIAYNSDTPNFPSETMLPEDRFTLKDRETKIELRFQSGNLVRN